MLDQAVSRTKSVVIENAFESLLNKIATRTARIGVIGLGYVGLPEVVEFGQAGFHVTGIDVDAKKVNSLNNGVSYVQDVDSKLLAPLVEEKKFEATTDFSCISELDTLNICVPTPLGKAKEPDLSYIMSALEPIKKYFRKGQLIILESTTYPGTTTEVLLPMLSDNRYKVGEDFFLVFSPERVDPGNEKFQTKNIPKVVGGVTPQCTKLAVTLYEQIVDQVVPVSSPSVAEMVKLLENTFRSVNIGLVNELALMCRAMKLNVWEVITAASTKPFGFMPFYPGPGVGGHCIPLDPCYLSWKARVVGFDPRFIDLATQVNSSMPEHVVNRTSEALNNHHKCLNGANVHIMGVTYKPNINDIRESPAMEVIKLLWERGAKVTYSDAYVPALSVYGRDLEETPLNTDILKNSDCVVILANHKIFDYGMVVEHASCIVDTRNALQGNAPEKVVTL